MILLLTHHTLMGLYRCRRCGRARSFTRTFVPLCAICAEQQKSHETAASSRRCAERRGPVCPGFPENTAVRRGHAVPSLLHGTTAAAVLTAVIFTASVTIIITPSSPARTGTPPDASRLWELRLQSTTVQSRKCPLTYTASPLLSPLLHRAPSTPQRHQKNYPPPPPCVRSVLPEL